MKYWHPHFTEDVPSLGKDTKGHSNQSGGSYFAMGLQAITQQTQAQICFVSDLLILNALQVSQKVFYITMKLSYCTMQ